jgi:peptide deformylase
MAVLEIIKHPDLLLRKKSEAVTVFDAELKKTLENMVETMHEANGIGLAGVQVAFMKRALVIDIGHAEDGDETASDQEAERAARESDRKSKSRPEYFVNPEILERRGETEYEEGCLSIPGVYGTIKRSEWIRLRYQDEKGVPHEMEAEGLRAIVLQHEIDHLNGVLFFDHLGSLSRSILLSKYKKSLK